MGAATKSASKPISERIGRFLREVRAELKKVVWPNRKELSTYTVVVIVTVAIVAVFISLVDLGFGHHLPRSLYHHPNKLHLALVLYHL
jgi:preprotein translocase subunit SecE